MAPDVTVNVMAYLTLHDVIKKKSEIFNFFFASFVSLLRIKTDSHITCRSHAMPCR